MKWSREARKLLGSDSLRQAFASNHRARTRGLLTISLMFFVGIFALRFAYESPDELVLLLCVVPIALVAIALGTLGGLAAAALSYGVFIAWVLITHAHVGVVDHLARALSFLFVGALVGYFTTQTRRLQERDSRWFELSLDIAGVAGFDGYWKRVNPTFEATLAYTQAEILKHPLLDFVHPDDVESTFEASAKLRNGSDVVGFHNRYQAKDGTYHWLEWACTSVPAEQLIYASAKDVTERKEAEQTLLEAEERFRAAFESAPIGMALVGLDGRWLQANNALCQLTGYSLEEILKVGFQDITHPDDREEDDKQLHRLRSGEIDTYRLEKRFLHAQGFPVWVSFNSSLVRVPGGPPLYLISQVEDISTRKELERQLRHLAQHDPLTGLFNRRRFDEELTRQLAHARRYQTSGALFILDLDNFKEVNDAHGHAAGDQVLNGVATILRTQLRATDMPARLGGDEFAVLLDDADLQGAERVASKLLAAVRGSAHGQEGGLAPIRLSIGIALLGPAGPSHEELMYQADHSMYRSKQQGGDRFSVYSDYESQTQESLAATASEGP